jgi:hypothetical protein
MLRGHKSNYHTNKNEQNTATQKKLPSREFVALEKKGVPGTWPRITNPGCLYTSSRKTRKAKHVNNSVEKMIYIGGETS